MSIGTWKHPAKTDWGRGAYRACSPQVSLPLSFPPQSLLYQEVDSSNFRWKCLPSSYSQGHSVLNDLSCSLLFPLPLVDPGTGRVTLFPGSTFQKYKQQVTIYTQIHTNTQIHTQRKTDIYTLQQHQYFLGHTVISQD